MEVFVDKNSIVRKIWGNSDTVLFIFAGSAAEFALNKAVDWLYFTGNLPSNPIGRLFSTVSYAQGIIFSKKETALKTIDKITAIHQGVEKQRGSTIPDWAYRDVLYMLIDYSIRSYELLQKKLSDAEKNEVYNVFHKVGKRMNLPGLSENFQQWLIAREIHMVQDLQKSRFTTDLFQQYKKHLGTIRYYFLLEAQKMVIPPRIASLLGFKIPSLLWPLLYLYKILDHLKLGWYIKRMLLPGKYIPQIKRLNI